MQGKEAQSQDVDSEGTYDLGVDAFEWRPGRPEPVPAAEDSEAEEPA